MKTHLPPQNFRCVLFQLVLLLVLGMTLRADAQVVTSVQPPNGATEVPLNSSIVFTFDVPIEPTTLFQLTIGGIISGSLNWSDNIDPLEMIPTWSAGNTVLTLNYTGDLPGSSTISWEINPDSSFLKLADEETFFPVQKTAGSFTTVEGSNCNPDGVPDSYGSYFLSKNLLYLQTSSSAPVLDPDSPALFFAGVESPAVNGVLAADLQLPGGGTENLFFAGGRYFTGGSFASQAEMDAAYPAGSYEMTMTRSIPPATVVPMTVPAAYPPTPRVTNFQPAQSVNPAANFTLTWEPFSSVAGDDRIVLTIEDGETTVFEAPDLCASIDLPNTATSIVIPAGTLASGRVYAGNLSFYKNFYFSTNSPAEFLTVGSMVKSTQFTINTGGVVPTPQPQLSTPSFTPGGRFTFTVSDLKIGTGYRVEYTTTLFPGSWTLLELLTPTTTSQPITDNGSSNLTGRRSYRVITQ